MSLRTALATLVLFTTPAFAQNLNLQALDDALVTQEGMTRSAPGLYVQHGDSSVSYVAVGQAGKQALLQEMLKTRDTLTARLTTTHSEAGQASLVLLNNEIDRLNQPQPKNQVITGHCSNQSVIYARALSSGGTSASAYAVDQGGGFSPPPSTTNYALAASDNHSNSQTTSTYTAATATVTDAQSCVAYSDAKVTCAGDASPTIEAYATSSRNTGSCE